VNLVSPFRCSAAMALAWGTIACGVVALTPTFGLGIQQAVPSPLPGPGARQLGTVKAVQERGLTLVTDSGSQMDVVIQESTRVLRMAPGQSDLKGAAPIELQEIQVGDRVLVRGKASEDAQSLAATLIVAMKKGDIEQQHAREREDWQKRGLGGLVKEVDLAAQIVTITTSALAGSKPVAVRISQGTILRRYAPNSVRFDDALPGKIEDIKPGDQLRARGTRSADGSEFAAEEIVTGSFRNVAGTVSAVDAAAGTLTVADLITKKPVLVRFTGDSTLRKLPAVMAEGIAMRLKGGGLNGPPGGPPTSVGDAAARPGGATPGGPRPGGPAGGWAGAGQPRGNGPPDFQQMLSRLPPATLAEFPKGEAVMIVSTQGTDSDDVTAITLVGGVEPLLRASPDGAQQMMLSPWSLGGAGAETPGQ
jgi:hypothetical protein